jgi:hypothetical protein
MDLQGPWSTAGLRSALGTIAGFAVLSGIAMRPKEGVMPTSGEQKPESRG